VRDFKHSIHNSFLQKKLQLSLFSVSSKDYNICEMLLLPCARHIHFFACKGKETEKEVKQEKSDFLDSPHDQCENEGGSERERAREVRE
jgi:hypothetical protein